MGYTCEKKVEGKEGKVMHVFFFTAWCFWDYEICLLKGPAGSAQRG